MNPVLARGLLLRRLTGCAGMLALVLGLVLTHGEAAAAALDRYSFQQPCMGTLFTLTLYATNAGAAEAGAKAAFTRVQQLNDVMTDYNPDSELMRLSRAPAGVAVSVGEDLLAILAHAQHHAEISDGAFDITVGPLVRHWRRARRSGELPSPETLARARQGTGWQQLRLDPAARTATLLTNHMQLDLGGVAKGWAADAALAVLRAHGLNRALVAASGDIAAGDAPPGTKGWSVGLGIPDAGDHQTTRTLLLANAAVSTSGDTEQSVEIAGRRYSHILDPRTGMGLTNRLQASVIARRAADTDPLATTVCVLGARAGMALIERLPGTAAIVVIKTDGGFETLETARAEAWLAPSPAK